jgi:hypothetical protein
LKTNGHPLAVTVLSFRKEFHNSDHTGRAVGVWLSLGTVGLPGTEKPKHLVFRDAHV